MPNCVLDGEIVSGEGFETVAKRDKQSSPVTISLMSMTHPVSFIAFDLLSLNGDPTYSQPYRRRRVALEALMGQYNNDRWGLTVMSLDPRFYELCASKGLEGVIAKRLDRTYRTGRTNDWIKYKVTHRVTCIAVSYEPGSGSRSHFGALNLAMLDPDNKPVVVGKVGTGFSNAETHRLKALIDSGQMPLVEIEAANVTRSGVLRFPSYKGERTDLSVLDATLDQLDLLPIT
jgi:bifunctional non-homologous end joining protein LigD